jgi:hypothetical protein
MSSPDCAIKQDRILRYNRETSTKLFQIYIRYVQAIYLDFTGGQLH